MPPQVRLGLPFGRPPEEDCSSMQGFRIDLHCHSIASNRPTEAVLRLLNCPESYSAPEAVYTQAKARGMSMVTITDHDSIEGAWGIADRADVIVGEELTCWFPEDSCKMHVVVWGLVPEEHGELQRRAKSIYEVAAYLESRGLAHAVAHPIYRQNDRLERWHLERLMLLFKGFECLNGAHSPLHREAFEPLLDQLTEQEVRRLSKRHQLRPHWPEAHVKARTGGSDDHGLLNVGRTWTEFPPEVKTREDVLRCLREGRCRPGGESGSAAKLAHTFYSVAVRYYGRHILGPAGKANLPTMLLQLLVGEREMPDQRAIAQMTIKARVRKIINSLIPPILKRRKENDGIAPIRDLFVASLKRRIGAHPELMEALKRALPPLGEHEEMFRLASEVNRDVTEQIAEGISASIDRASFTGLFNSIASVIAQQFVLSPYYFALFHQNKERNLLRRLTGFDRGATADSLRVGLFTDTFDETNGVSRFLRDMSRMARERGFDLTVHTCSPNATSGGANRKNFVPLLSRPLPCYEEIALHLPPVIEVLDFVDKQQYDVIHVSTPGPMGLVGCLAAEMLRVPLAGTYHTDFPAYCEALTGDHRVARGANGYMSWFYSRMERVFARSREYRASLGSFGVAPERVALVHPSVDCGKFDPRREDRGCWRAMGVTEPRRLLYVGRVSREKNLEMLVELFRMLSQRRRDVALIVAGDGPYRGEMQKELEGLPAYFPGNQDDERLARLYASADLFVFPSRTDTLGQVVLEAQESGLPVIVSDEGGPKEMTDDAVSGLVLPARDVEAWVSAIEALLDDEERRRQMGRAAHQRMQRYSLERTFESFWAEHLSLSRPANVDDSSIAARGVDSPIGRPGAPIGS